jgi:hypothetical protein
MQNRTGTLKDKMAPVKEESGNASKAAGEADPLAFFEEAYRAFQVAERNCRDSVERHFTIADYDVRLRFSSPALVPLIAPALEHLAIDQSLAPALTVCLWDSASTGIGMPAPPWSSENYGARGEINGYSNDRIHTVFDLGSCALSMLDLERNLGIFWIRDADRLPFWERGAPLRIIFHWWMRRHDNQLTHAAAVGNAEGGVLLVGRGGSGKSTTALACLDSRLKFVSDDYCLVGTRPAPHVYSIYSSGKLTLGSLEKFPGLETIFSQVETIKADKMLYFLGRKFHGKIATGFPLRAILLPHVRGGTETSLKPVSQISALRALAPSSIFQLPGAGRSEFETLTKLVRDIPCYALELGTDLRQIPEVIANLLSG